MRPGQPLRFLGWTVGGWVAMRMAMALIPAVEGLGEPTELAGPQMARSGEKQSAQRAAASALRLRPAIGDAIGMPRGDAVMLRGSSGQDVIDALSPDPSESPGPAIPAAQGEQSSGRRALTASPTPVGAGDKEPPLGGATGGGMPSRAAASVRWSAATWMLWRPDVTGGLAQAPLLGGSQLGARLDYRLTHGRLGQLGLYGRVSRALSGAPAEEAALGVMLRPTRAPVAVLAERRQRLGRGGRNGFALLFAGGMGPREVMPRLAVEGYAQAGLVGLPGLDGFADGKASLGYRLSPVSQPARLTIGASVSGGVQPGAGRLDIGPEVSLRLPTDAANLRLSVEWRERILGGARPARGPAVTLVSDF